MEKEMTFKVGDKIEVTNDGRHFYKTMIGDIYDNGLILIGIPVHKNAPMHLRVFDEVYLMHYNESGRYLTHARVVDFKENENARFALLEPLAPSEKNQRREFYRLPASMDVTLCEYTEGAEAILSLREDIKDAVVLADARAKDISITGISLVTKQECLRGDKYLLRMYLSGSGSKDKSPPFVICAEVRRAMFAPESGIYRIGMLFFGMTKNKKDHLNKYIRLQQQKRIVQKKIIEGD